MTATCAYADYDGCDRELVAACVACGVATCAHHGERIDTGEWMCEAHAWSLRANASRARRRERQRVAAAYAKEGSR